jgi:hypothetical protein
VPSIQASHLIQTLFRDNSSRREDRHKHGKLWAAHREGSALLHYLEPSLNLAFLFLQQLHVNAHARIFIPVNYRANGNVRGISTSKGTRCKHQIICDNAGYIIVNPHAQTDRRNCLASLITIYLQHLNFLIFGCHQLNFFLKLVLYIAISQIRLPVL